MRSGTVAAAATGLALLAGCERGAVEGGPTLAGADPGRGLAAIRRAGCGACHVVPGVDWPRGRTGPSLEGFAARALIGGRHPNRPEVLTGFVRNAQAYSPGSAMPPMPLTEQEARDVAAYLYTLDAR